MSEFLVRPTNYGFKFNNLQRLARLTRRFHFPYVDRFLRWVYNPDKRQRDYFEIVAGYDSDLMININSASFIEWSFFFTDITSRN